MSKLIAVCHLSKTEPLIIMAAGKGSRMRSGGNLPHWVLEEAQSRPKSMIRLGKDQKPLLHHLVEQARDEGFRNICIVIGEEDNITPFHFQTQPITGLQIDFVTQCIPSGRTKPEGTAQAVQLALEQHPEWTGFSVTVANGDNLPPKGMFRTMRKHPCCVPAFDSSHLGLDRDRIRAFAVIRRGPKGELIEIHEKPNFVDIANAKWKDGTVRVSMNYFRIPYADLLDAVRHAPLHPQRKERELPVALSRWSNLETRQIKIIPMAGAFIDLTHPEDILTSSKRLNNGGFQLQN